MVVIQLYTPLATTLFTSVFFLSSHWIRRFFTEQSVVFSLIDAVLPMAQPTMVWSAIAWLATAWPAITCPIMGQNPMVPTHNGSTSDGLVPQHQTEARSAGYHQHLKQKGEDIVACPACTSVFFLNSEWVRRFFINLNLLVFPFVYFHLFQGFFHWSISCSVFLLNSPLGLGSFSSNNPSVFLLSFSLGWKVFHRRQMLVFPLYQKRFFQTPAAHLDAFPSSCFSISVPSTSEVSYQWLPAWRSLHPRRETIVMPWHLARSRDLN